MEAFLIVISMHEIIGSERIGYFTLDGTQRLGADCSRGVVSAAFGLDSERSDIKGIVGKLIHQCFTNTHRVFHQDLLWDFFFLTQQVRGCSPVSSNSHGRLSRQRCNANTTLSGNAYIMITASHTIIHLLCLTSDSIHLSISRSLFSILSIHP